MGYQNENTEIIDIFEDISHVEKQAKVEEIKHLEKDNEIESKNKLLAKSLFFMPIFTLIYIISLNSNELINKRVGTLSLIIIVITTITLIMGIVKELKIKRKIKTYALNTTISLAYISVFVIAIISLYSPSSNLKNYIIEKAMSTSNHQYLATWFYDEETIINIKNSLKNLTQIDSNGSNKFNYAQKDGPIVTYANKYEEEILSNNSKSYYKNNEIYVVYDESNLIIEENGLEEMIKIDLLNNGIEKNQNVEVYNGIVIGKRKDNINIVLEIKNKKTTNEITKILVNYNVKDAYFINNKLLEESASNIIIK